MTYRESRNSLCTMLAAAALTLSAGSALAHDETFPVAGDALKMGWSPAGQKTRFAFKTSGQININPASLDQDPRTSRSTLLVRGGGGSPGSTGVIALDPARWSPIGNPDSPRGWKYKGDPPYTHGINKILIQSGRTNGSLKIQAKGYYWPFQINAAQETVEVVLSIGTNAFCAEFSADRQATFKADEQYKVAAQDAQAPATCPEVCGNGILEVGEECDDGNFVNNDTCTNLCTGCDPNMIQYDSTFDGIQHLIFDNPTYNCSNDACHGSSLQGGLDLRDGNSFASLVNVAAQINPNVKRVFPGDQDLSMLYLKIAEKTLGTVDAPGSSMPSGTPTAVTSDHLEAIRKWIRGGAPETGVVAGTAELLGSCLPPATPLDIPQPPVPDASVGTQFAMPGYPLLHQSEVEGCIASYYDVSATVPPEMMVDCPGAFPGTNETGLNPGKCFTYSGNDLFQDAQSHHSIVHIYPGEYGTGDPGWGGWKCYEGPTPGATCDPLVAGACGAGGVCGSHFHPGVACNATLLESWGAPDFNSSSSPQFSGSQESTASFDYPAGVYSVLPLKGLIVWNSHAFNLTTTDATMNGWINITYTSQRDYPAVGLFDSQWIFTQNVPPFQQREYCATHEFPEGTHLFSLSSHTHRHGVRWRYFDAPQATCSAPGAFTNPSCVPSGTMFYDSYDYSDPVTLRFDPPKVFSGSVADRTVKFCSVYDNGMTNADTVKRQSTSPIPTGNLIIGGPCANSETACMGGANKGLLCNNNDSNCPGSVCDACPLKGGVTTEDEMFIAIGTYYVVP